MVCPGTPVRPRGFVGVPRRFSNNLCIKLKSFQVRLFFASLIGIVPDENCTMHSLQLIFWALYLLISLGFFSSYLLASF